MTDSISGPKLELYDHQSQVDVPLDFLRDLAKRALPLCLQEIGPGECPLGKLPVVEINFVDDQEIARVHQEFMDLPDATDVITFGHGEILISTETAQNYGRKYGNSTDQELALYIIHGLLHLNGHEDASEKGAADMKNIQERILSAVSQGD